MASNETDAAKAARHLENLAVQFNDVADQHRSAANLLSAAANFVRAQEEQNKRLAGELAVQQAVAAENEAKLKGDVEVVKKLLNRTADIARADKSGAVTLRANVIGSMEMAVKVLNQASETPPLADANENKPAKEPAAASKAKTNKSGPKK